MQIRVNPVDVLILVPLLTLSRHDSNHVIGKMMSDSLKTDALRIETSNRQWQVVAALDFADGSKHGFDVGEKLLIGVQGFAEPPGWVKAVTALGDLVQGIL